MGFTKFLSEYHSENKSDKVSYLVKKFFKHNFIISLLISLSIAIFSIPLSKIFFSNDNYWSLLILFSISIPFTLVSSIIETYFRAIREINIYVKYSIICALFSLAIAIPAMLYFEIKGVVFVLTVSSLISIFIGFLFLKRKGILPNFRILSKVENSVFRDIYKIGIGMMLMMAIQQLSFLFIRTIIAKKLGINEVGIFQSVYSISNNYFGLFFVIIAAYSIPKLSILKTNALIIEELNQTIKLLILVYTPLILICFIFRYYIIQLLYTNNFIAAKELFYFQLQGDFLRALSWVFGLWLVPKMKIKQMILFDILFYFNLISISLYLLNVENMGVKSISIAYLIAYCFHFLINFIYAKYTLGFRFTKHNLQIFIYSFIAIIVLFILFEYFVNFGYYAVTPILLLWFIKCVNKDDLYKLRALFLGKLK